eukprot:SAG31_NODE_13327_length_876_cov_1.642214_1_plen_106_part_00
MLQKLEPLVNQRGSERIVACDIAGARSTRAVKSAANPSASVRCQERGKSVSERALSVAASPPYSTLLDLAMYRAMEKSPSSTSPVGKTSVGVCDPKPCAQPARPE